MGCLHPNTSQPGASLSQFAMSGVMSGGAGSDGAVSAPAASAAGLREAVLAGPARGVSLDGGVGSSVLGCLADGDVVESAVARAGHVDRRRRVLTGEVTVQVILGLCLFVGEGYDSVLARVLPRLPGALAPGGPVPTGSALSQARTRLVGHGEPMRELFEATAAVAEPPPARSRPSSPCPAGDGIRRPGWSPWSPAAPGGCGPPRSARTPPASRNSSTLWPAR